MNITGTSSSDVLIGTDQGDVINGKSGWDNITGGKGNDTITGGAGVDDFVFHFGDGNDVILDFKGLDTVAYDRKTGLYHVTDGHDQLQFWKGSWEMFDTGFNVPKDYNTPVQVGDVYATYINHIVDNQIVSVEHHYMTVGATSNGSVTFTWEDGDSVTLQGVLPSQFALRDIWMIDPT